MLYCSSRKHTATGNKSLLPITIEEHGLSVFENKVLRRIFGPKREEVTGEWGKLHNEEFRIL
jgi:hypothetical protein